MEFTPKYAVGQIVYRNLGGETLVPFLITGIYMTVTGIYYVNNAPFGPLFYAIAEKSLYETNNNND